MPQARRAAARVLAPLDGWFAARSRLVRWLPAVLWYGMIFVLTAMPGMDGASTQSALGRFGLGDWNAVLRSGAHVGVFGALTLLLLGAVRGGVLGPTASQADSPSGSDTMARDEGTRGAPGSGSQARWRRQRAVAVVVTVLLAASDEWHQTWVPGRHGRLIDLAWDVLGVTLAILVVTVASRQADTSEPVASSS